MMYRFLLFSYPEYYPCGGVGDLCISFNTVKELEDNYSKNERSLSEYIEVFDTKTGEIVNKSDNFSEVVKEVKRYLENENNKEDL